MTTIGSLFSGIGGIELGLEAETGAETIWQAENDPAALRVLERWWPTVRRYTDVREVDERAARPDILCGGFPCQDISNAGKRVGIDGAKSGLWSEFARIIRAVRPRVVFVENVAALAARGLDRVLGDLASLGFDAVWDVLRASDIGAPHLRARLFILAYAHGVDLRLQPWWRNGEGGADPSRSADDGEQRDVPDADRIRRDEGIRRGREPGRWPESDDAHGAERGSNEGNIHPTASDGGGQVRQGEAQPRRRSGVVADPVLSGQRASERDICAWQPDADGRSKGDVAYASSERGRGLSARRTDGQDATESHGGGPRILTGGRAAHRFPPGPDQIRGWAGPQPAIRRGDDGFPGRSHRLRLLGNSVVPQQAALAWRTLTAVAAAQSARAA